MNIRQTLLACATGATLLLSTQAQAGGPVIVEDAYEAEPAPKLTPGEKLAIAAGIIIVGALIVGGGGSGDCTCNDLPDDGGESCGC